MSTKMSTDMHLNRPSSRVLAAPGGGSSISLGGDDTTQINTAPHSRHVKGGADTINLGSSNEPPAPVHSRRHTSGGSDTIDLGDGSVPPPPAPSAGITADTSVAADTVEEGEEEGEQPRVGILVGGELAAEELTSAITKALRRAGVTPAAATVMARVEDVAVLPYAAQNMLQGCDVLLVSAVLMDPVGSIAPALTSTMLSMALGGTVPIIPGFVVQKSLLEAKALLGENAAKWAKSVALMLKLQAGGTVNVAPAPEPVIEEVPVHTPEVDDVSTLLAIFRESLKSKGARSFAGLQRKFKIIDDDGSGKIDIAEFTKAVKEHALGWTVGQIQQVFDHFDTDKSKNIDFDEFIVGVRGHLNDRRRQLVLMAFQLLDADHSGTVELNDIEAKYDASQHPDVIAGKKSESEVLSEFLDTFDTMEKDGKVSTEEFCKYYANLSASIDEDDYFELMIRNAWHISGGEGWCANSSCRRVAVIHVDGSQTVEEIKNDLGIGADDKDKMFQNLLDQGITDMEYIQLNDGSKYHPANYKVQKPAAATPATPPRSSAAAAAAAVVEAAAAQKEAPKAAGSPTKPKKDITQTAPASAASGAAQNRRRAPGGASSIVFG